MYLHLDEIFVLQFSKRIFIFNTGIHLDFFQLLKIL